FALFSEIAENLTQALIQFKRGFAMPVTARQRQVLEFISRYQETHNQPPTIAEIGMQFKMSSSASVHSILIALEREGLIKRIPNVSRGIELIEQETTNDSYEIPLLGTVAAGQPIEAILTHDTVAVPRDMVGQGRTFALRVRGDSMIEENIQDGDTIIVSAQRTAQNGQMVVALIDGNYATVKKFYREPDFIRLEPANPQFKPIFIKTPERIEIQGIVRGLVRRYAAPAA
ncbi:MAG: transcriptional repressor LexA, partial [Pyrinomonadaceae bacterium]